MDKTEKLIDWEEDEREDRNRNGLIEATERDPGEDWDRDGLFDVYEDSNRNGVRKTASTPSSSSVDGATAGAAPPAFVTGAWPSSAEVSRAAVNWSQIDPPPAAL